MGRFGLFPPLMTRGKVRVQTLKSAVSGHKLGRARAPRVEKNQAKPPKERRVPLYAPANAAIGSTVSLPVATDSSSSAALHLPKFAQEPKDDQAKKQKQQAKKKKKKQNKPNGPERQPYDLSKDSIACRRWNYKMYRDRFGCYSDPASLQSYFAPFTPDPAGFVERNMKRKLCLDVLLQRGRRRLQDTIWKFREKLFPEVWQATTLKELQEYPPFKRLVAAICDSSFADVCNLTQAFIVLFIRHRFRVTQRLQKEAIALANGEKVAACQPPQPKEAAKPAAPPTKS